MIAKFGFDFADPYFGFAGVQFAFRLATPENVYATDPEKTTVREIDGRLRVEAQGLQFAGGQRRSPGRLTAELWREHGEICFRAEAEHA